MTNEPTPDELHSFCKVACELSSQTDRPYFIAIADRLRRLAECEKAIVDHNRECAEMCGLGDQEGVQCKYRPYFPRRCPDCPKRNWAIAMSVEQESK